MSSNLHFQSSNFEPTKITKNSPHKKAIAEAEALKKKEEEAEEKKKAEEAAQAKKDEEEAFLLLVGCQESRS